MSSSTSREDPLVSRFAPGAVRRPIAFMFAVTALSWLGEYVHNLYELPQLSVLSPENSIIAVISLTLLCVWWLTPFSRLALFLLLSWGLLHLIGGAIISVMPFPFLPFYPEQTLDHYAAHLVYGLAQIPLIVVAIKQIRAPQPR